jgi:hypothetical protein
VGRTSGKLRHLSYEQPVLITPIEDDLLVQHHVYQVRQVRATILRYKLGGLLHTRLPEHVVTPADTLFETEAAEQLTEVVEGDVCVRCPAENASEKSIVLGHDTRLQQLCDLA